jgi:putative addiction module component (TIGR02574 family)
MNTSLESIAFEALELPTDQRATLAYKILTSIELESEAGVDEAWQNEIEKRIKAYDQGGVHTIPAVDAFNCMKKIAPL